MISLPSIMTIVFTIVSLLKLAFKKYKNFENFVPMIAGVLGAIVGLVAFYVVPTIVPTDNVFHALIFGLTNGLSTTGCVQLVGQIKALTQTTKTDTTNVANNNTTITQENNDNTITQENNVSTNVAEDIKSTDTDAQKPTDTNIQNTNIEK